MIDITKNTTPHGLLREIDPEAAAALEAWPHGVEAFFDDEGRWKRLGRPSWQARYVFRAIPAPVRVVRWHNLYRDGSISIGYESSEDADSGKLGHRIAVLRIERDEDGGNVDVEAV